MSNQFILERTRFEAVHADKSSDDGVTYGYRFSDDHAAEFTDTLSVEDMSTDRLEFLRMILEDLPATQQIGEMFSYIASCNKGITIDGVYFEWEEIQSIFRDTNYK